MSGLRDRFEADGYAVLRGAVSPSTLDAIRRHLATVVDDLARAWRDDGALADLRADLPFERRWAALRADMPAARPVTWRRVVVSQPFHALWQEPALLSAARELLGDELWAHELFNARPREPNAPVQTIHWHQDACNSKEWDAADGTIVTVWVPLVPVDERSGCLAVVPRSHRLGLLPSSLDEYGIGRLADPSSVTEEVTVPLEPGDALLFGDLTLHRSLPNVADTVRWSVDVRYCRANDALKRKAPGGHLCHSLADSGAVESFEDWRAKWDPATGVMRSHLRRLDLFARTLGDAARDYRTY